MRAPQPFSPVFDKTEKTRRGIRHRPDPKFQNPWDFEVMASAMRGKDDGAEANVKKATTSTTAEAAPKPVVTNPVVARQITQACALFCLMEFVMFAYVVCLHFSVDGPLWEAFAWSAGEAPLFFIPVCLVPWMRAELISIYSEEPSDDGNGSDLSTNLLGNENV